ncbi:hypothetical protein CEXT_30911 [Caerostris extrusa]|uniref:Uncharacterized protein n=1 Tax=Caerostris extrusa TaxID=172846 RepID=A0AAV4XSE8_CAEEX|nr:hypothetical protein CEXT_30911 [Caerostris extrusa]
MNGLRLLHYTSFHAVNCSMYPPMQKYPLTSFTNALRISVFNVMLGNPDMLQKLQTVPLRVLKTRGNFSDAEKKVFNKKVFQIIG